MDSNVGVWRRTAAPSIAAVLGYSAWKCKPQSFDRETYWMALVATGAVASLIIVLAMRIRAIGGTWQHVRYALQFEDSEAQSPVKYRS
jgi:hypothetical protein